MAKPRDLVVRFLSDVSGFLRGTDQVEQAYRDVATQADRTTDQVKGDAAELAHAYERAADKIKHEVRSSKADTTGKFGETGKEAGQEFVQNLGESISSGDLSGVASDTAGGLAATFGAAGPIGAAFAAVATVASVAFASISAAAEAASQRAQGAFDDLMAAATQQAKLRRVLEERFGTFEKGLVELQKLSDTTGINVTEITDALTEGGPAAARVAQQAGAIRKEAQGAALYAGRARVTNSQTNQDSLAAAGELLDLTNQQTAAIDRATRAEKIRKAALRESTAAASDLWSYTVGGIPTARVPTHTTGKR